jgi:glutamyl-tRNA reductase
MVGITYRGASLSLLERVAVRRDERAGVLAALRAGGCSEAVLLSTCSRVEIYLGHATSDPDRLLEVTLNVLAKHSGAPREELREAAEIRSGKAVVEHLFLLTAGLRSRVLGEVEILPQTQAAFREAAAAGMASAVMSRLFPAALRSGRRVRAETPLGLHARSLGHQAVEVGLTSLGGTADPLVLVVGSGNMASAAVDHLAGLGLQPSVAARDERYAARLAGPGSVCPLPALSRGIADADLLICATSAAHHVVTVEHVSRAMAGRVHPLTVVDLSVPRNVDSAVAMVPGVTLIDLEGLNEDGTAEPGLAAALLAGAAIAKAGAHAFIESLAARDAGPLIAALRSRVERTCLEELTYSVGRGSVGRGSVGTGEVGRGSAGTGEVGRGSGTGEVDSDALARSAHAIAGKLLHRPTIAARRAAAGGDAEGLRYLCDLFGIPPGDAGLAEADPGPPAVGAQIAAR